MIVCHIHGARPRGLSDVPAQRALSGIGTALYREFLRIALEKEYGFTPKMRRKTWWARLLGLKG